MGSTTTSFKIFASKLGVSEAVVSKLRRLCLICKKGSLCDLQAAYHSITSEVLLLACPSLRGLKIQIHVCGTYVLSVWFTLLIGYGSVWIFSRPAYCLMC